MALLVMIFRKMIKNKWLELSLLAGLVLSVALVSSMPIYTESILQKMLVKDLENNQLESGKYPGGFAASAYMNDDTKEEQIYPYLHALDDFMEKQALPSFGLPVQQFVRQYSAAQMHFLPLDPTKVDADTNRYGRITALSELYGNIRLIDGRLPSKEAKNGVYEVLVTNGLLTKMNLVLGNELIVDGKDAKQKIVVKLVGVFAKKDNASLYWHGKNLNMFDDAFVIDYDLFKKDFLTSKAAKMQLAYWFIEMDYTKFDLQKVSQYLNTYSWVKNRFSGNFSFGTVEGNATTTLVHYGDREKRLRTMLWSLNVPVLIMLAFYLYMVSNLIMERQKNEIAVLRSRGASRFQIMFSYTIESILLGLLAYVLGPPLAVVFTKMLGSSNGFLEFVQRTAIHVKTDAMSYRYALYAVLASILMTLVPAFRATRATIVSYKRDLARKQGSAIWHKIFLDIILIGISLYGLNMFHRRMNDLLSLGLDSKDLKMDPLLFLVPALFMLGAVIFILRVYPWMIRLIYLTGKKWWPPSLYAALIQVGRSGTQYQFLMVFLILTISTGLFSASAARTLNKNVADKISYANGADIALDIRWANNNPGGFAPNAQAPGDSGSQADAAKKIQYVEPPFQPFTDLPGVEHVAKVFTKQKATVNLGSSNSFVTLMGIETDEFGQTEWYRSGLLNHHINEYLNLIAAEPSAVLISKTLADQDHVKVGDTLIMGWDSLNPQPFTVYGIVDYFPTFNPNPQSTDKNASPPMLVVANLSYIQNNLTVEPYQVWLKMKPGAERKPLFDALLERKIPVTSIQDTIQRLIDAKNDSFQMAVNGELTLGFIISILISFFGFLLYWILSFNSRLLQFGIFNAIGISFRQLIAMMAAEQALTSGAAVLIGGLIGKLASRIFVPMFQLAFDPKTQVPPFLVVFRAQDTLQLFIIIGLMITIGLLILGFILSRIKIHQALKLGED